MTTKIMENEIEYIKTGHAVLKLNGNTLVGEEAILVSKTLEGEPIELKIKITELNEVWIFVPPANYVHLGKFKTRSE